MSLSDVTLVLTTFLRDGYLFDCLTGIEKNLPECALVIVDDGYPSDRKTALKARMTYEVLPFDSGLTQKRNAGVKLTRTKYVLLGHDDFDFSTPEVRRGVEKLVKVLDENPHVDVASGRANGWAYEGFMELVPGCYIKETRLKPTGSQPFYKVDLTVNYFIARTETLLEVPWDDRMKIGGEHGDWFFELKLRNKFVVWVPDVNINAYKVNDSKMHPSYNQYRNRAVGLGHRIFLEKRGIKNYYGFDDKIPTNIFVPPPTKLPLVQALWVGDKLSMMEQLSISSFLRQGHEYHLYTYQPVESVPKSVVVRDANGIIPLTTLHYKNFTTLGLFSDYFRYKLLLDKGGWWVDTDTVCIKPFNFTDEYVFSSEALRDGKTHINGGNMKAPVNSPFIKHCWETCLATDISNPHWGICGPALVKSAVEMFGLQQFVQPPDVFCPVRLWDVPKFILPGAILNLPTNAKAIHLWNTGWAWGKINKDTFPAGSPYETLKRQYLDPKPVPKVSIIIPCFNHAEFLSQCIDSALAQTHPNIEVIVVNDGSTDCSLEVAKKYGNRIQVVDQSNQGLPGARNAGIRHSSGEFILPLDADDWIDKDFVEKTLPLMTEGVGVVTTHITYFGPTNYGDWQPNKPTLQRIIRENCVCGNSLIRYAAFSETGGYNPKMVWGFEDWNLWIDIIKRGWKVEVLPERLFHYRTHQHSMLSNAHLHHAELVAIIHNLHPELYESPSTIRNAPVPTPRKTPVPTPRALSPEQELIELQRRCNEAARIMQKKFPPPKP